MNKVIQEKHNKYISDFVRKVKNNRYIDAVLLVGSMARDPNSYKDIDILVMASDQSKVNIEEYIPEGIVEFYTLDDALRFEVDGGYEMSYVLKGTKEIVEEIELINAGEKIERENRPWAIGGYIPEIFLFDIATSKTLYASNNGFEAIISGVRKGPSDLLKGSLRDNVLVELRQKALGQYKSKLISEAAVVDVKIALLRMLFVQNDMYFPGLKHVNEYPDLRVFVDEIQELSERNLSKAEGIFELIVKKDGSE